MSDPTPPSMDTVTLHGVQWNRCRRCRRLRPLQRLMVPRFSPIVDTNPPFYEYECRDIDRCDSVRRALERLGGDMDVTVGRVTRVLTNPGLRAGGIRVRPSDGRPGGVAGMAPPRYPSQRALAVRDRLERLRRIAWEDRLREWMSTHVTLTAAGYPHYDPPAPDRTPQDQRWANWFAYTEHEALYVALVRSYGCRCVYPLLGWTMPPPESAHVPTPRCRTCNAEAS